MKAEPELFRALACLRGYASYLRAFSIIEPPAMRFEYVPLLELQRELLCLPRNYERFVKYLRIITGGSADDVAFPPLVAINPMAREHVPALIEEYQKLKAEDIATAAAAEASHALADQEGDYKIALAMMDDVKGSWTNRYDWEFKLSCATYTRHGPKARRRNQWLTATLWASEPASTAAVRQAILMTAFRVAYAARYGSPRTIGRMLAQEGYALARAGCEGPALEPDDLQYTRSVIAEHWDSADVPTAMTCLYGDAATHSFGFRALGLGHRAGFALARHESRRTSLAISDA
jgi:hypothetical protein